MRMPVGHAQIWCDIAYRIDDGPGRVPTAAEQVRDRNRIGVEKLTQNHAGLLERNDRFP
jgi:hypothetical protein